MSNATVAYPRVSLEKVEISVVSAQACNDRKAPEESTTHKTTKLTTNTISLC